MVRVRHPIFALGCLAALASAAGADCTFVPDPSSRSFAAAGGSGRVVVLVDPGCAWTATSNRPAFLRVISGARGTGPGVVEFSLAPNRRGKRRQGTLRIAAASLTVTQGAAFADVPPTDPAAREIGRLSARGITLGCGGEDYCPDQVVTQGELAELLIKAVGQPNPPQPATQRFIDVPPTSPFYPFVEQMALRHITLGCGGGNYCPQAAVPREQMAALVLRSLGEFDPPPPAMQRFLDVPPSNPFYAFIEEMAVRGLAVECGCDVFCPSVPLTRREAAQFLVRAFDR